MTWLSARDAFSHVLEQELIPDVARKKLIDKLRVGAIPCRATVLDHRNEKQADAVIPPDFWDHYTRLSIDFEKGTATSARFSLSQPMRGPTEYVGHSSASGVELSKRHLLVLWPSIEPTARAIKEAQMKGLKDRRGATSIIDWEPILIEAARFMYAKQEAGTLEALMEHLRDWLNHPDGGPSATAMKQHLAPLWREFKKIDD